MVAVGRGMFRGMGRDFILCLRSPKHERDLPQAVVRKDLQERHVLRRSLRMGAGAERSHAWRVVCSLRIQPTETRNRG